MNGLRSALSYFTILPVGATAAPDAAALAWLPLVGALVGGLAGAVALGVAQFAPHPIVVATAFAALLVLTGAIHADGFLDGCDAFLATVSVERRFEILKDPRHGTYAVAGGAVLGVMLLAALASLAPARLPLELALAGASARFGAVLPAFWIPYGRGGASARAFESRPALLPLTLGAIVIAALALPLGLAGVAAVLAALVCACACALLIAPRLGGALVGDAYGFAICVAETGALVAVACSGTIGR